jgi:hypothetical protein
MKIKREKGRLFINESLVSNELDIINEIIGVLFEEYDVPIEYERFSNCYHIYVGEFKLASNYEEKNIINMEEDKIIEFVKGKYNHIERFIKSTINKDFDTEIDF